MIFDITDLGKKIGKQVYSLCQDTENNKTKKLSVIEFVKAA
jgi:hypothetical protein